MCELEWLLSMHYYNLYSVCHVLKRCPVINNFVFYLSGVLDKFPSFFFTCPYMPHSTLKNKWSTLFIKVINSWDYCTDQLPLTPWYINSWDYCTDQLPLTPWYINSWDYCTDQLPLTPWYINSWDYCTDQLPLTPWYINSWDYCTDQLPLTPWYIHSWDYCADQLPLDILTAETTVQINCHLIY